MDATPTPTPTATPSEDVEPTESNLTPPPTNTTMLAAASSSASIATALAGLLAVGGFALVVPLRQVRRRR